MSTVNHAQIAPFMKKLEEAKALSKAEERAALKKKLKYTIECRKSGWRDTSDNEDIVTAARRGLIREHIAKADIMKQMGMGDIPSFAEVWANYLEENAAKNQPKCATSNCGCESSH
jgi:hypothetical protein